MHIKFVNDLDDWQAVRTIVTEYNSIKKYADRIMLSLKVAKIYFNYALNYPHVCKILVAYDDYAYPIAIIFFQIVTPMNADGVQEAKGFVVGAYTNPSKSSKHLTDALKQKYMEWLKQENIREVEAYMRKDVPLRALDKLGFKIKYVVVSQEVK